MIFILGILVLLTENIHGDDTIFIVVVKTLHFQLKRCQHRHERRNICDAELGPSRRGGTYLGQMAASALSFPANCSLSSFSGCKNPSCQAFSKLMTVGIWGLLSVSRRRPSSTRLGHQWHKCGSPPYCKGAHWFVWFHPLALIDLSTWLPKCLGVCQVSRICKLFGLNGLWAPRGKILGRPALWSWSTLHGYWSVKWTELLLHCTLKESSQ